MGQNAGDGIVWYPGQKVTDPLENPLSSCPHQSAVDPAVPPRWATLIALRKSAKMPENSGKNLDRMLIPTTKSTICDNIPTILALWAKQHYFKKQP